MTSSKPITIKYERLVTENFISYEFYALNNRIYGVVSRAKKGKKAKWACNGVTFDCEPYPQKMTNRYLAQLRLEILIFVTELVGDAVDDDLSNPIPNYKRRTK